MTCPKLVMEEGATSTAPRATGDGILNAQSTLRLPHVPVTTWRWYGGLLAWLRESQLQCLYRAMQRGDGEMTRRQLPDVCAEL